MTGASEQSPRRFGSATLVLAWAAAFLIALALDVPVAHLCKPVANLVKHSEVAEEVKEGGHFIFVSVVAVFLWVLHPASWRASAMLGLAATAAGTINFVIKWIVGRSRPVVVIDTFALDPLRGGLLGFWHQNNLSFPSGHSCVAFATAACLSYLVPRGKWAFFVGATLVALERVAELAHYLSDTVAGAAVGLLAFHATLALCRRINCQATPALLPAAPLLSPGN